MPRKISSICDFAFKHHASILLKHNICDKTKNMKIHRGSILIDLLNKAAQNKTDLIYMDPNTSFRFCSSMNKLCKKVISETQPQRRCLVQRDSEMTGSERAPRQSTRFRRRVRLNFSKIKKVHINVRDDESHLEPLVTSTTTTKSKSQFLQICASWNRNNIRNHSAI